MAMALSVELGALELVVPEGPEPLGTRVLAAIVGLAEAAAERLAQLRRDRLTAAALVSRLRGTGRGVSFSKLVAELEREHPVELQYPFEGSDRVGGAVWIARDLIRKEGVTNDGHSSTRDRGVKGSTTSVAKLCWDSRAMDLPMHVHDQSDRFIVVAKGRGFFHVSDEPFERFTGGRVRSIPARERDVFLFARGTVHTFSTEAEPMTLLSCQLPFLPFDDPRQYRLPKVRWTAKERPEGYRASIACDPGWSILAERRAVELADVLTMGP